MATGTAPDFGISAPAASTATAGLYGIDLPRRADAHADTQPRGYSGQRARTGVRSRGLSRLRPDAALNMPLLIEIVASA
jgi:hypothetical protein